MKQKSDKERITGECSNSGPGSGSPQEREEASMQEINGWHPSDGGGMGSRQQQKVIGGIDQTSEYIKDDESKVSVRQKGITSMER